MTTPPTCPDEYTGGYITHTPLMTPSTWIAQSVLMAQSVVAMRHLQAVIRLETDRLAHVSRRRHELVGWRILGEGEQRVERLIGLGSGLVSGSGSGSGFGLGLGLGWRASVAHT